MRERISFSRAGTRSRVPASPFSFPTSNANAARTFNRCSNVVSIASIFVRQSPIFSPRILPPPILVNTDGQDIGVWYLAVLVSQKLAPETLRRKPPLKEKRPRPLWRGAAGVSRLLRFVAIFLSHPRASRRPAPRKREAVSKGETVIKRSHARSNFLSAALVQP